MKRADTKVVSNSVHTNIQRSVRYYNKQNCTLAPPKCLDSFREVDNEGIATRMKR